MVLIMTIINYILQCVEKGLNAQFQKTFNLGNI